jgi:uncharacterized protein
MHWIEIFGYIGAFFIGLIMGILGGGGSILAVPILAYIFHFDEKVATAYSLFIVGSTGLIGGLKQALNKVVDWKAAAIFGIPAVVGITTVRKFVVPNLPDVLFNIESFEFTRRMGMFGLFAALMILAAFSMLSEKKEKPKRNNTNKFNPLILSEGLFIGGLTGLVGAGGGFLIVPALMVIAQLDMKKASGTSLIIIAFNSLTGFFLGDATQIDINWSFLGVFVSIAIAGIIIGTYLNQMLPVKFLKKSFAYFIIAMAIFIFIEEFIIG